MSSFLRKALFLLFALNVAGFPALQAASMPLLALNQMHAQNQNTVAAVSSEFDSAMPLMSHQSMKHAVHLSGETKHPCAPGHRQNCTAMCYCLTALPASGVAAPAPALPLKSNLPRIAHNEYPEGFSTLPMRKPPRAA